MPVVKAAVQALEWLEAKQALPALKTMAAHDTRWTEDSVLLADVARRAIEKSLPFGESRQIW